MIRSPRAWASGVAFAALCGVLVLWPGSEAQARKCRFPPLWFEYLCLGMNPVPVTDVATLAQEAKNLVENINKFNLLDNQLLLQIQKLTDLTNMLRIAGHPQDQPGASTHMGQMKATHDVLGREGPATFFQNGRDRVSIPMPEGAGRSRLPDGMSTSNHRSIPALTQSGDRFFRQGGSLNQATLDQRRSYASDESLDANATAVSALSKLEDADEDVRKLAEAVKTSKDVREDWQANTKVKIAVMEALATRITLLTRLNGVDAIRSAASAGDDADRVQ